MRRPVALAAAAAAVFLLTSCAADDAGPGSPGTTQSPAASASAPPTATSPESLHPEPSATTDIEPKQGSGPDKVADEVARQFWASDTRTDSNPADAAARAAAWLTPDYAKSVTTALPTGAAWQQLTDHDAHYTVEVTDVDDATDTASTTSASTVRTRLVTLTPAGAKGWTGEPRYLVATFTLTGGDGAPWLVDRIDVDESVTGVSDDGHSH